MSATNVICLDIESYGAAEHNRRGFPLPKQTVFHPQRSLHTDGVQLQDLILTCSITLPAQEGGLWTTTTSSSCLDASSSCLSGLTPGLSFCMQMDVPEQRRRLAKWIQWADTILGMNLLFDIGYLRTWSDFRYLLNGRHTLIDLSIINYLHNEDRPEKSLKDLGPILGTHVYGETLKHKRFRRPDDPDLISYNCQDTHNTIAAIAALATRIERDHGNPIVIRPSHEQFPEKISAPVQLQHGSSKPVPLDSQGREALLGGPHSEGGQGPRPVPTHPGRGHQGPEGTPAGTTGGSTWKLTPTCLSFYSRTIWTVLRMSEAGIPMDRPALQKYEDKLLARTTRINRVLSRVIQFNLEGTGSAKAKQAFLDLVCDVIDGVTRCDTLTDCSNQMALRLAPSEKESATDFLSYSSGSSLRSSVRDSPLLRLTPKKKEISVDEENRNFLGGQLPRGSILGKVLRLWKIHTFSQKLASTYTYPLLHHRRNYPSDRSSVLLTDGHASIAYPSWYITPSPFKDGSGGSGGTIQGRITCKKPPAQTFPQQIQAFITSRFRGGSIISFDLSQIELRVAGLLSSDPVLLNNYREGRDLHTDRALQVFGESTLIEKYGVDFRDDEVFKSDRRGERQVSKHLNFADLFRSGADTMQATVLELSGIEFPLDFFTNIVRTRPSTRPGLWAWQERLIKTARNQGKIEIPITGQSRNFMGGEKYDVNEIVNFPIQTTAGNVMLAIMHEIHHRLPSLGMQQNILPFLNVFDSCKLDVRRGYEEETHLLIAESVREVATNGYWARLQDLYGNEVPLLYEVKTT